MIDVATWPVSQLNDARQSGTLDTSPEYQRRPVWNQRDQMLLIDSIARGVPIGAVTMYVSNENGYEEYEVIDGKQRITALLSFLSDELAVRTAQIANATMDDEEIGGDDDAVSRDFHGRLFSELDTRERMRILQYRLPVFLVEGPRDRAIRAFARMNRNPYTLRPQEIRNAFYSKTEFLNSAIKVAQNIDSTAFGNSGSSDLSMLVHLGAISRQSWDRMQDLQLISELLTLVLRGPQHRRDTLDETYSLYRNPSGASARQLSSATEQVEALLMQIWRLTDGTSLQAFHFPSACENDVYGLVGALNERGPLTRPQLDELGPELITVISEFRSQVEEFIAKIRDGGSPQPDEYDPLVEQYGRGFLGGQTNARVRREARISIWVELINGVVATLDPRAGFSPTQRRLIWARSSDKLCARCNEVVRWEDFHAGHQLARALGGRTTVDNGRVEHAHCNQSAGAAN